MQEEKNQEIKEKLFTETEVREILNRELSKQAGNLNNLTIRAKCLKNSVELNKSTTIDTEIILRDADKFYNYILNGKK